MPAWAASIPRIVDRAQLASPARPRIDNQNQKTGAPLRRGYLHAKIDSHPLYETLTAEKAVELYEQHLADNFSERDIRHCLRGKDLACWCALDEPCHADVLLRIANSRPK